MPVRDIINISRENLKSKLGIELDSGWRNDLHASLES